MRPQPTVLTPANNSSVTAAAIGFLILVCISLTGLIAWTIWEERTDQLLESQITSDNMSRSLARHADDTFKAADTSLLGLSERVLVDGTSPAALARLHRLLMLRVKELPQLQGIAIFDENSVRIVNSLPGDTAHTINSDREYFIFHKTNSNPGPHIGAPFRVRSSGEWIIPLSRRLDNADGQFAGVILATIKISYFTDFYKTFNIGRDGAIALILSNGTQIARQPLLPDSLGKDLSAGPLYALYKHGNGDGSAMIKSMQDGIERLNGYRRLAYYPLFVTTALSKTEILSSWHRLAIVRGLITLGIVVVIAMLGMRLVRQIGMRIRAEEEARNARDALQELNATLEKLAQQDGLTGLANRRKFDQAINHALSRAKQSATPLAVILIDVDYFKKFNDLYGHVAGDECLRQVAAIIKASEKRSSDLAARYGGEEFAVLLPDTNLDGALVVAESIRKALHALKIEHAGNAAGIVTVSAGIDVLTSITEKDSAASFVSAADAALYSAKASGRDRVQIHRTTLAAD